jgi:hypothetical protein
MGSDPPDQRRAKRESPWTPEVVKLLPELVGAGGSKRRRALRAMYPPVPLEYPFWCPGCRSYDLRRHKRVRDASASHKRCTPDSGRMISVLAAVLASKTFLRFRERAEKDRTAAQAWAALRRDMEAMIALHPTYAESHGDPKKYLDDVRQTFAEIAQQSPRWASRVGGDHDAATAAASRSRYGSTGPSGLDASSFAAASPAANRANAHGANLSRPTCQSRRIGSREGFPVARPGVSSSKPADDAPGHTRTRRGG